MKRATAHSIHLAPIVLVALLVSLAQVPLGSQAGAAQTDTSTPALLSIGFGPSQIWSPDRGPVTSDLFQCGQKLACVQGIMLANGASPDAVAFFHLTGWFLSDIQGSGMVQLGTIFVPWRANENSQTAFLGGMPAVVYAEQEARDLFLDRNDAYQAILAAYPNTMFWAPGPGVEGTAPSPDGGQRFLLRYRLLDGCHACAIVGWVHTAFDFGPDGTYEGLRLLSVEPT